MNKLYNCDNPNCKEVFRHRQSKDKHSLNCGKKKLVFPGDNCTYTASRKDTLLRHRRNCNGLLEEIRCSICSKGFQCNAWLHI